MFTFPYPVPDGAFSIPLRWGPGLPGETFGVSITARSTARPGTRLNVFGYRMSISGTIAAAVSGAVVLELRAAGILIDRIVHTLVPFRPAPATGGPIWFQLPVGGSITARCDVPLTPIGSDVLEARVLVWGFEEVIP